MITANKNNKRDFRLRLYQKYVSDYKSLTSVKSEKDRKSDYEIFKNRYLPLISEFPKSCKIIEIGCGNGYVMQFLKEQGYTDIYGIDISEEQVNSARAKGLNVEVKNIFEFFESNTDRYDVIFALDFVEHFAKDELLDLFSGINNLLTDTGVLILHTPNGSGLFPGRIIYGDLTHLSIFNQESLIQILRLTGFDNIRFYEVGPVPKNIKGMIRVLLWKFIRIIFRSIKIIETGNSSKILTQSLVCYSKKK